MAREGKGKETARDWSVTAQIMPLYIIYNIFQVKSRDIAIIFALCCRYAIICCAIMRALFLENMGLHANDRDGKGKERRPACTPLDSGASPE